MIAIVRHCRTLWEGHKIWNNLLPVLTKQLFLLSSIKTSGRFFQSFVALSEKLDFKNTNRQYHWNAFGWKIKQNNSTSIMISSHYALSLHGVISVLQLHTTLSKNHYNIGIQIWLSKMVFIGKIKKYLLHIWAQLKAKGHVLSFP